MKEQLRKIALFVSLLLLLVIAAISAKTIGDKIYEYRSYDSLLPIAKVSKPLITLVDEIQTERTLASIYFAVKDEATQKILHQQFQKTDRQFEILEAELKTAGTDLLSIPPAELAKKRRDLAFTRETLTKSDQKYFHTFNSYNQVIDDLMVFQDKIFTFPTGTEFKKTVTSLKDAGGLKEVIAKEQAFVAFHLATTALSGDLPLLSQDIFFHSAHEDRLRASEDKEFAQQVEQVFTSKEYDTFMDVQLQLRENSQKLLGSTNRTEEYLKKTSGFLNQLKNLTFMAQKKLQSYAENGLAQLRSNVLWTTAGFAVILLFLVGLSVFIRKTTSRPDQESR